jgi:hypothetical protein
VAPQVTILAETPPTVSALKRENVVVDKQVVYEAANLYEAGATPPVLTDECLLLGANLARAFYPIMLRERFEPHNTYVLELFGLRIYKILV